ncbi:hypothetical protein SAMN04488115_109201 [Bosea lathyri]|uniref:Uncharacterized protein n=1 Tax=Bosea lathyri TaxID=1036778 RepID=A0A1H6CAP1_9HYPH|nr:hypothetical protein SAMN04488115_109201 [Bosea lathyri]
MTNGQTKPPVSVAVTANTSGPDIDPKNPNRFTADVTGPTWLGGDDLAISAMNTPFQPMVVAPAMIIHA